MPVLNNTAIGSGDTVREINPWKSSNQNRIGKTIRIGSLARNGVAAFTRAADVRSKRNWSQWIRQSIRAKTRYKMARKNALECFLLPTE